MDIIKISKNIRSLAHSFLTIYPLPLWERNKERGVASPLVGEGKGEGEFNKSSKHATKLYKNRI